MRKRNSKRLEITSRMLFGTIPEQEEWMGDQDLPDVV